jgi:glyoxylase-like metal-dependent hydrolase (beta-lactamase superfamily II)
MHPERRKPEGAAGGGTALVELAPGLRRLRAPNPGIMTGAGTNTYLLGFEQIAVLDPGPADERHVSAIRQAAKGSIEWILATHTHLDHSPAAARLAEATGAQVIGRPPPPGERQDRGFSPARVPGDGERLALGGCSVVALHTPGHASNHVCYLEERSGWLFTGDHLLNGSTVVIDPPDGDMARYLESLRRLRALALKKAAPGHGEPIDEPREAIDALIAHRLEREAKVVAALRRLGSASLETLLPEVYADVEAARHPIAARSLLAHLLKLREEGRARHRDGRWTLRAR